MSTGSGLKTSVSMDSGSSASGVVSYHFTLYFASALKFFIGQYIVGPPGAGVQGPPVFTPIQEETAGGVEPTQ
jgi:hypothetical protein